jgi:hypothetical protein
MDALAGLGRDAAFRRVYQIPGLQKVNQALGRLVRAPGQHAKVLLHCSRFAEPSYAALLAADYQMFAEVASDGDLREWPGGGRRIAREIVQLIPHRAMRVSHQAADVPRPQLPARLIRKCGNNPRCSDTTAGNIHHKEGVA